jgi:hypothetical protein
MSRRSSARSMRGAPMMHISAGLEPSELAQPNRREEALHGATARRPRPDSAASRDRGNKPLLAGVRAAQRQECRRDCWKSINGTVLIRRGGPLHPFQTSSLGGSDLVNEDRWR